MTRLGLLLTVAVVLILVEVSWLQNRTDYSGDGPSVRRPLPESGFQSPRRPVPSAREGTPLDPPSPTDPPLQVAASGPPRDSAGTAFAVDSRGRWMTARHVVEDCDRVAIVVGPREARLVEQTTLHPRADLALLALPYLRPPLAAGKPALRAGQDGFSFGFPATRWGQVHSLLIGRARQRMQGRYRRVEPVLVWSVSSRQPQHLRDYGGISGGPILDRSGTVIGVHTTGQRRRGRLMTVAPVNVMGMLSRNGIRGRKAVAAPLDSRDLTDKRYARFGQALRVRNIVAQIVCDILE